MKKRSFCGIACLLAAVLFLLTGCQEAISPDDITYVQYEMPQEGDDIAIFDTSMGKIVVLLYTEEVPTVVQNFKDLVNQGFFDGQIIFYVEPDVTAVAFGSSTEDGNGGLTNKGERALKAEISYNLWPFSGSVCAICYESGVYFSKDIYFDSRSFFIGSNEVSEEDESLMDQYEFPELLQNGFVALGGEPSLSQYHTVYGKVIYGMDVVDSFFSVDMYKLDAEDEESTTMRPTKDIVIHSVTLSSYHAEDYDHLDNCLTQEEYDKLYAKSAFDQAAKDAAKNNS